MLLGLRLRGPAVKKAQITKETGQNHMFFKLRYMSNYFPHVLVGVDYLSFLFLSGIEKHIVLKFLLDKVVNFRGFFFIYKLKAHLFQ